MARHPFFSSHPVAARRLSLGVAHVAVMAGAGCNLPRGAALPSEVLRGTEDETSNVQVIAVSRDTLPGLQDWPLARPELRHSWPSASASATARLIRAGDIVNIAVWDSQADSLLTTGDARSVRMEAIPVSASGEVFIPYVGDVRVAGMTSDRARRVIQERLTPIVRDGQVQLSVEAGSRNTIDVVSGVGSPGRVQLPEISPTILSVLAETGGISNTLRNPLVRLTRAGHGYAIPARVLLSTPSADIQLMGGDRIVVEEDQRSFIALGATGREQVVYFEREEISALDALSSIGGLADDRANIQGVLVLRVYPDSALRPDSAQGPQRNEVVFTFDLSSADGLFAARRFMIEPGDVLLATESEAPLVMRVIGILRSGATLAN